MQIQLSSKHHSFISCDHNGQVSARKTTEPGDNEVLTLEPVMANIYLLRSRHGFYLGATPEGVVTLTSNEPNEPQHWRVSSDKGKVTFRSHFGRFLTAEPSGTVLADRTKAKGWEHFLIRIAPGAKVHVKSHHQKYLSSDQDYQVTCIQGTPGPWETFTAAVGRHNRTCLRSAHAKYLCLEKSGTVVADRGQAKEWESMRLEVHLDGRIAFKSTFDTYMSALSDGRVTATTKECGALEQFTVSHPEEFS
eukprot:gb/GECH01013930.1/.p1 GENE.gb/GECH01013930.1/~~gb/GECH01013930.1/.p1  ORF type:complete len:249 (+),score=25.69 gb/GECH01013930.1/:1-747(+)